MKQIFLAGHFLALTLKLKACHLYSFQLQQFLRKQPNKSVKTWPYTQLLKLALILFVVYQPKLRNFLVRLVFNLTINVQRYTFMSSPKPRARTSLAHRLLTLPAYPHQTLQTAPHLAFVRPAPKKNDRDLYLNLDRQRKKNSACGL